MRVTEMTKFIVAQAAVEAKISKQEVMERVLVSTFPAHEKSYQVLNKGLNK